MGDEQLGQQAGVVAMAAHAQRQRLDPPQHQPGGERVGAGAQVQQLPPGGGVPLGLGEQGDPADDVVVAAEILGGRVDHHGGAVLDRPAQVGGGDGVVHHQRHAGVGGHLREAGQVGDGHGRVGDGLGVHRPGARPHRGAGGVRVGGVDEGDVDPEPGRHVGQQRERPAVEVPLGEQVVAGAGQRQQRGGDGAHAGGGGQALGRALQVGDGRLQHRGGGVLVAGVDEALARLPESVGVVLGVVEGERRGLPDRRGQRPLGREWLTAGVDRARGEAVGHAHPSFGSPGSLAAPGPPGSRLGRARQDPLAEAVALDGAADAADGADPPVAGDQPGATA
jgi:hypothetical protein